MKISMLALALATAAWAQAPNTKLFSKIYGCEAAVSIANAMGASVEGWTYERIEQTQNFRRTRTRCRAAPRQAAEAAYAACLNETRKKGGQCRDAYVDGKLRVS